MFTGIIETVGTVTEVLDRSTTRRLTIESPALAESLRVGESVSVDGACLTVAGLDGDRFHLDVIGTTLARTIAGGYAEGSRVNLERALRSDGRLDGHFVQGHVDGVGHLEHVVRDGEYWQMDFRIPDDVAAATIEHGSIALNGVSLTVSEVPAADAVRIGIIPVTWNGTNLGGLRPGDAVNVEGDLIGKYVNRMLVARGQRPGEGSR